MAGAPIPECIGGDPGENCQPVQAVVLCDQHPPPDAGDGALVPFLRIFLYDCATGAIVGTIDRTLDGSPYAVEGTVENCCCDDAAGGLSVVQRTICDRGTDPQTCFLRTEVYDGLTLIGSIDTLADGITPYAPVGPIDFSCEIDQDLTTTRARRENLTGPTVWNLPGNVLSLTVKCRAVGGATVTITDAVGTISEMFVGDEETWEAACGCLLSGPFTVTLSDPGDLVTLLWTEEV